MNLAGVVQQLQKERDQAARVVECLDVALAALNGGSSGKRMGHGEALVGSSKGEDRGCPESAVGKGAEEWRAETKRRRHAEEENDVSRRSKEDCRSPTGEMGEVQGGEEEGSVTVLITVPQRGTRRVPGFNGKILTHKTKRRLRGDRQPVHRLRSAAAQLDRRARCRPCRASCRCLMRQQTLHRAATRLSPSARRATGQVPQDCQACSQAENRSALRCSGRWYRREEPQPISLRLVCGCAAGQGLGARAAGRECARHEGRGMV